MSELTKMEKMLLHAGRMLNTTLEYEELMKLVLELAIKATDSEAGLVYRIDEDVNSMRVRYMKSDEDEAFYFKVPKGEGIIGWVAENREPQVVHDLAGDPRFSKAINDYVDIDLKSTMAVPLIGRARMIGVIEVINKRDAEYSDNDLDTLVGLANQFAVAITNANLYREAQQSAENLELLFEVSKKMSGTLNVGEALNQILKSLRKVVGFHSGGVYLIDEIHGEVSTIFTDGYEKESDKYIKLKIGQGLVGWTARTGEPVIVQDVAKDDRYLSGNTKTKSEIVVPIKMDDRIIGVINLESNEINAYKQNSLDLVTAFASHAAVTLERAKMHSSMLENKRLEEQLKIARDIQLTFLPKSPPDLKGYDIAGINIPSGEVGGDYFDFIRILDNQTGISIADVSGKGIPAALIMASYRASIIAEIRNNYSIRTICRKVNSLLYESIESGNFVTAFYGVLDSKNDIFTFSNCGHNQPIMIRRDDKIEMLAEGGPALGVIPNIEFEERPIFLQAGDAILFYTDGVTEIYDKNNVEFGEKRLIELFKKYKELPAKEVYENIIKNVKEFAAEDHMFDDLTIIILKKL